MAGTMKRILDHLIYPPWRVRRAFPAKTLKAIEDAVAASESLHRGELRFVVEAGLSFSELWRGTTARQRALAVFSDLHVWDTEDNSGVLIYVLLADRQVEILADRGINIQAISTSEIKVSVLIDEDETELAVRVLHTGYGLDAE